MLKFFKLLKNGEFGLAQTYWIYTIIIGNFILPLLYIPWIELKSLFGLVITTICILIYDVLVSIGIWNAGEKYEGWIGWVVISRIMIFLGILSVVFGIINL